MSDTPASIWRALAAIQRQLPHVDKAHVADTGKFTYRYASLNDVHDALLPLLDEHGCVWVVTANVNDRATFVGTLHHVESGTDVTSTWPAPSVDDPQRLGSALTYARRYMLCAIVGLVPDVDDDGAAATRASSLPRRTMSNLLDLVDRAHDVGVQGDFDAAIDFAAESIDNIAKAYAKIERAIDERTATAPDGY